MSGNRTGVSATECQCNPPMDEHCQTTWLDCADYNTLYDNFNNFNYAGDSIYKTFIDVRGDINNREFTDAVGAIANSPSTAVQQLTYDLFQLAAARVKCDQSSSGGTGGMSALSNAWWEGNIYGTTAIGKAIYWLSLLATYYLIIRILSALILEKDLFKVQLAPRLSGAGPMVPIIIMVIVFLIITTIVVNYTIPHKGASTEETVEMRATAITVLSWISVFMFAITLGLSYFGKDGFGLISYLSDIANIATFAMLLFFNMAIGAYIPQFALVALLVQKYYFSSWGDSAIDHLIRVVVTLSLFSIGWYIWNSASSYATPSGGRYSPNHILGGVYTFFVGTTVGQSALLFAKGVPPVASAADTSATWTLLFFPLFQGINSLVTSKRAQEIFARNRDIFS
jgi:hypothetical protein